MTPSKSVPALLAAVAQLEKEHAFTIRSAGLAGVFAALTEYVRETDARLSELEGRPHGE